MELLTKWLEGDDVWALAIVQPHSPPTSEDSEQPPPPAPDMQELLVEFVDVFDEPNELPPRRTLDHAIKLKPGTQPVNVRPY